jgi:DNA-binding phage protein
MIDETQAIRMRYKALNPVLDEQGRRRFAAIEAMTLGRGGVALVARITGLARSTIYNGIRDIENNRLAGPDRVRRPGGGRKKKIVEDPTLLRDLRAEVEPDTRGDPMKPLLWTTKSLSHLTDVLTRKGHSVCRAVIHGLLRGMGYSLQTNQKTLEGGQHADRDDQFNYINAQVKDFLSSGDPVISVDTKKKEIVGNYKNNGREWRSKNNPEKVKVHDFPDKVLGRAVPYGVYDIGDNSGWVNVGKNHDTASFATNAIRRWWLAIGKQRYPNAKRLLITADGGGSNGYRVRLWKVELHKLSIELRIPITVCHLPPGTSKWNKIEHRLFSFITINWRGKPLRSYRTVVELICATTTKTGLTVRAELDENTYPTGVKVTNKQLAAVNITRHIFHGEWNYTIAPCSSP